MLARMRRPPEEPAARRGQPPSFGVTTTGSMLQSGRAPGAMALALPGRGSNHIMPLFISTPVEGSTTRLPIEESSVVVTATRLPSRSTTVRCVVQVSPGSFAAAAAPSPASRSL